MVRLSPQRADPHHIAEHADRVLVRLVDLAEPHPLEPLLRELAANFLRVAGDDLLAQFADLAR
eukprot:12626140-Alexandrium_andersonii.AAC.1